MLWKKRNKTLGEYIEQDIKRGVTHYRSSYRFGGTCSIHDFWLIKVDWYKDFVPTFKQNCHA